MPMHDHRLVAQQHSSIAPQCTAEGQPMVSGCSRAVATLPTAHLWVHSTQLHPCNSAACPRPRGHTSRCEGLPRSACRLASGLPRQPATAPSQGTSTCRTAETHPCMPEQQYARPRQSPKLRCATQRSVSQAIHRLGCGETSACPLVDRRHAPTYLQPCCTSPGLEQRHEAPRGARVPAPARAC